MTAALVAAPAGPQDDGDEVVLDRKLCRCGRLAAVVLHHEDGDVWAAVRCGCGAFVPAGTATESAISTAPPVCKGVTGASRRPPSEGGRP